MQKNKWKGPWYQYHLIFCILSFKIPFLFNWKHTWKIHICRFLPNYCPPALFVFCWVFFFKKITYFSSKKWRCYVQMLMLKYFMLRKSVHVQCMVNIITIERLNYSLCWLFFIINDELIKLRRWWESHYIYSRCLNC